jgi:hypothetical protein
LRWTYWRQDLQACLPAEQRKADGDESAEGNPLARKQVSCVRYVWRFRERRWQAVQREALIVLGKLEGRLVRRDLTERQMGLSIRLISSSLTTTGI